MSPAPTRPKSGRSAPGAERPAEPPAPLAPEAGPAGSPFPAARPEARRLAAAILEVLAGAQLPAEAARGLGVSLARYYQLEVRAVAGLVAACEGRRRGRGRAPESDLGRCGASASGCAASAPASRPW